MPRPNSSAVISLLPNITPRCGGWFVCLCPVVPKAHWSIQPINAALTLNLIGGVGGMFQYKSEDKGSSKNLTVLFLCQAHTQIKPQLRG